MKTTLAIVATVLFMILAACGEPDYIQVNEPETVDAGAPAKHDMQFPEADAGAAADNGPETSCQYVLYYRDEDGDGYGDAMMGILADCEGSYHPGWATEAGDCRDSNPDVYPGAPEICNNRDDDCNMVIDDDCADESPIPTLFVSLSPNSPFGAAVPGVDTRVLEFNLQSTGENIVIQGFMLEFHGCALGSETRLYRLDNFLQFGDTEVASWNTIFETQSFLTATTAPVSMLVSLDTSACQSNETVQAIITGIITATTSYPVNGVPLTGHPITF